MQVTYLKRTTGNLTQYVALPGDVSIDGIKVKCYSNSDDSFWSIDIEMRPILVAGAGYTKIDKVEYEAAFSEALQAICAHNLILTNTLLAGATTPYPYDNYR